ncbi:MMPL family transporter [Bacillus aquiflavi]|nr:MMPL family transporter [Bacillus aquiflavi]
MPLNNKLNTRAKKSLSHTVSKMIPAVLSALIATVLGFIALYTSPVPMIKDFGKMLTIGMIISFFVGVFILIPILFTRDLFFREKTVKSKGKTNKKQSNSENFLGTYTEKIISLRWGIMIVAFITAGFGIFLDMNASVETDVETFMPQDTQALKDLHNLRDIIGTTDQVTIVYKGKNIMSENILTWVNDTTESLLSNFSDVVVSSKSITSVLKQLNEGTLPEGNQLKAQIEQIPEDQLKLFMNEDQTKGLITVGIKHLDSKSLQTFLNDLKVYLNENEYEMVTITVTGKTVLDVEMISALTTGRYKMTFLGMGLVFLGLLLVYRHPVKAFIPLLPIIFIIGWSGAVMYFLDINYTPLTATLGALIIGIGTEFTVLIMERFYEERKKGKGSKDAVKISNQKVGRAIFTSAFTTIGGFSALLVSDFAILSNFGLMTLINISFALLSTVVVMPAILIIFDRFVKIKHIGGKEIQGIEVK